MKQIKISNLYLWASLLGFVSIGVPFILGLWFPFMYLILVVSVLSLSYWIYDNRNTIKNILVNPNVYERSGQYVVIFVAFLVVLGINFLSTKYNTSKDITTDQINTLSQESKKVLNALENKISFKVYYTEESPPAVRLMLKKLFNLYQKESSKVQTQFLNAKWDPEAAEYLTKEDQQQVVVYVENEKSKERVPEPVSEESITTAMIRLQSQVKYKVYFTQGHGEKSITDSTPLGLTELAKALSSRGVESVPLSLLNLKGGEMPKDLYALLIVGPVKAFSESELNILKAYIEDGGKLLLALDPESMLGFNSILKPLGVEYKNHFVVSVKSSLPLYVLGSDFSRISDITSEFVSSQVVFPISGSLQTNLKSIPKTVQIETLVSTDEYAFSASSPTEVQKVLQQISSQGSMEGQKFDLAVEIKGQTGTVQDPLHAGHSHEAQFKTGQDFNIIAFSDSDFVSNEVIDQFFNKDLILNSVIYLTGQKDLISIRPNQARPTTINITPMGLNIGALMSFMPFIFFSIMALVFWFRKRSM